MNNIQFLRITVHKDKEEMVKKVITYSSKYLFPYLDVDWSSEPYQRTRDYMMKEDRHSFLRINWAITLDGETIVINLS